MNLKLADNAWKLVNIICLGENGLRGILESLKDETGLTYTTVKDMEFVWNSPNYKGGKKTLIKGKGFSTKNAVLQPGAIQNYFKKNGFRSDTLNPDGFKKGDVVISFNGQDDNLSTSELLAYAARTTKPEQQIPVVVVRDGSRRTLQLPMQK